MREMPATFDAALELAIQLESVETAQRRLYKEVRQGEVSAIAVQTDVQLQVTPQTEANASSIITNQDPNTTSAKLEQMSKELQ